MDQRIVQLSRTVEELLQASFDLLEASEHDDALVRDLGALWGMEAAKTVCLGLAASFDGSCIENPLSCMCFTAPEYTLHVLENLVPDLLQPASAPRHSADGTAVAQVNRGVSQPPNRLPMEQLMLSHRAANGVSERLLLDIVSSRFSS